VEYSIARRVRADERRLQSAVAGMGEIRSGTRYVSPYT
jgi:hypothetical protein